MVPERTNETPTPRSRPATGRGFNSVDPASSSIPTLRGCDAPEVPSRWPWLRLYGRHEQLTYVRHKNERSVRHVTDARPMISYAQNHEDVVLDRALHAAKGFYVDVGAASPSTASVTRHFYDLGWSGINIEPLPQYVEELRRERPRDWTIEAVAGASPGHSSFYVVEGDQDLSTFDSRRVEEMTAQGTRTERRTVEAVTLNAVLEQAQPETIDFLKIDTEGTEREVLLGINLQKWRPRVLLIEATLPNSQIPSHGEWEDLVLKQGYHYASFDGINRYYAAEEESPLVDRLAPANVLDHFVPAYVQLIKDELERVRSAYDRLEQEIGQKNEQMEATAEYVRHIEREGRMRESGGARPQ
jgi:FkbM family methyltransferase